MNRPPNSKSNLERAISRYAGNDAVRANELAVALSNAIVAQMIGAGVVKGGGSHSKRFPDWFKDGISSRPSKGRKCFTDWNFFTKDSPLVPSGLLGPVELR